MNKVRLFRNFQEERTGQRYLYEYKEIKEKREKEAKVEGEEEGEGRKLWPNMPDKQIEKYSVKKLNASFLYARPRRRLSG